MLVRSLDLFEFAGLMSLLFILSLTSDARLDAVTGQRVLLDSMVNSGIKSMEPDFVFVLTHIAIRTIHQNIFVVDIVHIPLGRLFDFLALYGLMPTLGYVVPGCRAFVAAVLIRLILGNQVLAFSDDSGVPFNELGSSCTRLLTLPPLRIWRAERSRHPDVLCVAGLR